MKFICSRDLCVLAFAVMASSTISSCACNKTNEQPLSAGTCVKDSDCATGKCTSGVCAPVTPPVTAPKECQQGETPRPLCMCQGDTCSGFVGGSCSVTQPDGTQTNCQYGDTVGFQDALANTDGSVNYSPGITVDEQGNLILSKNVSPTKYIFIVNSGEGTVSKFSTSVAPYSAQDPESLNPDGSFRELARYFTGSKGGGFKTGNDPSRTSLNIYGDAYVGNRSAKTVTKFSGVADALHCPDRNANGFTTSSSSIGVDDNSDGKIDHYDPTPDAIFVDGKLARFVAKALPWRSDDCMLWSTDGAVAAVGNMIAPGSVDVGSRIRAVAAQDIPQGDGRIQQSVWIGGWEDGAPDGYMWKLDGVTGEVLVGGVTNNTKVKAPVGPYGFALDGQGNLWVSNYDRQGLGRVNTNLCTSNTSCRLSNNDASCVETSMTSCLDAPKEFIEAPTSIGALYGVTVDKKQRVWIGGNHINAYLAYDDSTPPKLKPKSSRTWISSADYFGDPYIAGVAADSVGFVYGGHRGGISVVHGDQFVSNAGAATSYIELASTMGNTYGMAVDGEGKIWGIHVNPGDTDLSSKWFASVLKPTAPAGVDLTTLTPSNFPLHDRGSSVPPAEANQSTLGLIYPYTYSDMTGEQARLARTQFGYFQQIFNACENPKQSGAPSWEKFYWEAAGIVPTKTHIVWQARTSNDINDFKKSPADFPFVAIGSTNGNPSPTLVSGAAVDLSTVMGLATDKTYLEVRVELWVDSLDFVGTPAIKSFEASFSCKAIPL